MSNEPGMQLTDAGRAQIRRMRALFVPVRAALVLSLVTWPVGGPVNAWHHTGLQPFMVLLTLMVVLERTGITEDPSARSRDRWSKLALVLTVFAPLMAGVWLRVAAPATAPPWASAALPVYVQGVGAVVWLAGMLLRRWAMMVLGRFFTDRVRIFSDHQLVTAGPYARVRHPSYAGLALVLLGAPLCLGNAVAVAGCAALGGAALAFRIRVEEAALLEAFGDTYLSYADRVPRLIPRL